MGVRQLQEGNVSVRRDKGQGTSNLTQGTLKARWNVLGDVGFPIHITSLKDIQEGFCI